MNKDLVREAKGTSTATKVAPYIVVIGLMVIMFALGYGIYLSTVGADYFTLTKVVRDGAELGSSALGQLGTIVSSEKWLLPLTFTGLALLLGGIGLVLSSIIRTIQVRSLVLAEALPRLVGGESK